MTEPSHTDRPNGGETFTLRGLHAYFVLWLESMERFYDERFRAMDEKTTLALANSKEAINKAEVATEKRFDSVNEFRQTLSDQTATFMPRAEATVTFANMGEKFDALAKDIIALRESRSQNAGERVQTQWLIATFIAAVPTVLILFELLSRKP